MSRTYRKSSITDKNTLETYVKNQYHRFAGTFWITAKLTDPEFHKKIYQRQCRDGKYEMNFPKSFHNAKDDRLKWKKLSKHILNYHANYDESLELTNKNNKKDYYKYY